MVASPCQILALADIEPEAWDQVAGATSPSPKLRHDWARSMAAVYSRNGALAVLTVGPPDAPQALLPLSVSPGRLRWHRFIANDDGGLSVPCRDPAALPALAAGLIRLGKPVDLGYYPADDPFVGEIQRAAKGRAQVIVRPQDIPAAPWLDIDPSWQEPTTHLRRNLRQSLRRNERRMRELGEFRPVFHVPSEHEVDALIDAALTVEAKGWKHRTGTALIDDAKQTAFFRHYAKAAARAGRMHFAFLELDGTPVAMNIGEIHAGAFWSYKIGYDEAHAKFGPGALMQYNVIADAARRGLTRVELQGQLVEYKRSWTDKAVGTVAIRIYPYTPRGIAAMGSDAYRKIRKARESREVAAAKQHPKPDAAGTPAANG